MAGTLILDDDLMVLQRKGDFDIKDDYYETEFPGQFPNIRIDTDIFHFSGEDLRYSCVEYVLDSGEFVRIDGDIMRGNLEIRVPFDGVINQVENNPELILQGFRTGTDPYAEIILKNEGRTSGFEQKIVAIGPNESSSKESYVQVGKTAFTNTGQIMMSGSKLDICALSSEASLNYITDNEWDVNPLSGTYRDMATDIPEQSKRLNWNAKGGSLSNSLGKASLEWNDVGVYIWGNSGRLIEVVDGHARYVGEIENDNDITTKKYVDEKDAKYIPLKGTRVTAAEGYQLEQDAVDGAIDFTSTGALNAKVNNQLRLQRNDVNKLTIGGTTDDNVHIVNANLNVHDNKIMNVPLPSDLNTDPDKLNAVPKEYIDNQVGGLKDVVDNITDISAPPGMINAYVGKIAPTGWLLCQKDVTYKCGDYPKMHKALGGSQNDIDTNPDREYKVPDLSGRVLVQSGVISTSNSSSPAGNTHMQPVDQSTALPYKNRQNSNNLGPFIRAGSHNHYVSTHQIEKIFNHTNSYFDIVTNDAGKHSHEFGNTDKVDGSSSAGRIYANRNGNAKTADAGLHKHNVTTVRNSNSNTQIFYTDTDYAVLKASEFDPYTMPYAFTINWIIKHDNKIEDPTNS